ncbi:FkbM family methyltransferase [Prosthecomicrobium pneumaticum]|uniref:FkbM family methyltransferase n=1 Tax=Prosthecomicrobium pneumaticum TaxID=81895 RepID=A0A7W9FQW0_9HYPH|nr:FkbM family methyltransferase [Prosthecomicrobium pneumaticum]MBB5755116.1 FkbM family methyltransferase [Prosthecomicrobium pneumaticum]
MQNGLIELATQWLYQFLERQSGEGLTLAATRTGPVFVRRGDIIGDAMVAHGAWDYFLYPVIESFASRRGTALDVGAQFGVISCVMAKHFDRVVSIEPNFESFRILTLNTLIRPNITPINACAYDAHTTMSLSPPDEQDIAIPLDPSGHLDFGATDNVGSLSFSERGTGLNRVHTIRIDDLALADLTLMKVDVQGADGRVLLGARETIARHRPTILFEWEDHLSAHHGVSLGEVRGLLEGAGYRIDVLFSHNDKQTDYIARPAG